jgi:hypothetical protein
VLHRRKKRAFRIPLKPSFHFGTSAFEIPVIRLTPLSSSLPCLIFRQVTMRFYFIFFCWVERFGCTHIITAAHSDIGDNQVNVWVTGQEHQMKYLLYITHDLIFIILIVQIPDPEPNLLTPTTRNVRILSVPAAEADAGVKPSA